LNIQNKEDLSCPIKISYQSPFSKACEIASRDDDMVVHRNADDFARLYDLFGDCNILLAWLRVPARVIMYQNNAGGMLNDGMAKHFLADA